MRLAKWILHRSYRWYAITSNVVVGKRVHIGLGTHVWAPSRLVIADDVYIGKRCTIEVDGEIGPGCLIANSVGMVGRKDHDMRQIGKPIRYARWVGADEGSDLRTSIHVGADVWIGYGAILLGSVNIGTGAVVSAGAVVIHDVAPYTIVAGNPAREIGMRFDAAAQLTHHDLLTRKRGNLS